MKKVFSIFMTFALLVAGVTMTGCNNKNNPDQPKEVKTYQMSIKASKGADNNSQANGPRKALGLDGSTLNASWAVGEQVRVYNETYDEYLEGYLTPESDDVTANLSGTLTGYVEAGDKLRLEFLGPNYSSQAGTLAYIAANCDYAIAEHVDVESAENGVISTDGTADFVNQQAIVKFRLIHEGNNALNVTEFVITAGSNTYTVTPASATNVLYVAIPGYIGGMTFTATDGTNNYTHTKAVADLYNGFYYTTEIDMTLVPPTPAPTDLGPFSVSSSQQVYFSEGNLQATYDGSSWTWAFATNQWDYIGSATANTAINGNGTVSTNGTVDLFGWSTSANYYGINNATTGGSSYVGDFVDWGTLMGTGWRTLASSEWAYLFNTREGAKASTVDGTADARYAKATVNSVQGLILFPDGGSFEASEFTAVGSINTASAAFTTTTCTSAQWEDLEDKGCVFLPAAGIRNVADVFLAGDGGYYHTSTPYETTNSYEMYFSSSSLNPQGNYGRYNGCAVRLAIDY